MSCSEIVHVHSAKDEMVSMINTERLILTPVREEDIDIYTQMLTRADITRYLPSGKPYSLEYIENYLSKRVAHWARGFGTFIVSLKANPAVKIGYAGVETIPDVGLSDIRYGILTEYQGFGYAYEAAKAVLDFTWQTTCLSKVYGVAVIDNTASVNLLQKLGLSPVNETLYDDGNDLVTMAIER
ncbi:GNAT family N-acetyltransferase [Celerinatantimonas diazotrophica]|nr:GNAT family N-acetyltransferase [Celerinatantimonas diazotrophica]